MNPNCGMAVSGIKETTLTEQLTDNCNKARMALEQAQRIASNLFPPRPCEQGNAIEVVCAVDKAREESGVMDELNSVLNFIIARL